MKYSSHNTYTNSSEIEVPSVTTILKIINKPFLAKWANIMGFKRRKIEDILEESSFIGTFVHTAIECHMLGKQMQMILPRAGKTIIYEHLNAYFEWRKEHEIEPEFMEKSLTTSTFGGTVDFYGTYDGKKTIIDFKTSKKFYSTMFLQLGAYVHMIEEQGDTVEQVAIVRINANKHKVKILTREEIEPYRLIFLKLAEVFHLLFDLSEAEGWTDLFEKK